MDCYSLLRHENVRAVVAYRQGQPVPVVEFLGDVAVLAAALPQRPWVVNMSVDRYRFTVGLAAALLRRQVTLLLPARVPGLWTEIVDQYPDLYEISDTMIDGKPVDEVGACVDREAALAALPKLAFPADQIAVIAFTSGTTGRQTPHAKSWGSLVRSTRAAGERFGLGRLGASAMIGTVPHHHMYGLESIILLALQHGGAFHAEHPFYPRDVSNSLDAAPRPRILVTTPIHLRSLVMDATALPPADMLLCATAPLSPQLAALAEARFQAPLHEIYGCSEAGQFAVRRTVDSAKWASLDGFHMRQDCHGTFVCTGPDTTGTALGDVIELHTTTQFLLHGRTSDLVNIAGKRTSLAYLNYHLNSIEGVQDGTFVMPEDDSARISRLAAYIVASPAVSAEFVIERLRERIDAAFLPRPLHLVTALPRDANGKLTLAALREVVRLSAGDGT